MLRDQLGALAEHSKTLLQKALLYYVGLIGLTLAAYILFVDLPLCRNLICAPNGGLAVTYRTEYLALPHP
jgi:hypothetical protein